MPTYTTNKKLIAATAAFRIGNVANKDDVKDLKKLIEKMQRTSFINAFADDIATWIQDDMRAFGYDQPEINATFVLDHPIDVDYNYEGSATLTVCVKVLYATQPTPFLLSSCDEIDLHENNTISFTRCLDYNVEYDKDNRFAIKDFERISY